MNHKSDFLSFLEISKNEIDLILETFLDKWLEEIKEVSPTILPIAEEFKKCCTNGGKRIRGALVNLGYELANGKPTHDVKFEIIRAAAAFEVFNTAILAHDDIIDEDELRRDDKSLWYALGGGHRGISHAICLGDIGFFLAFKTLASLKLPEERKVKAIDCFAQTTIHTGVGEVLDVELSYPNMERTEEDVLSISRLKTAWYTITGPLQLGAILGGADEEFLKKLIPFGENLGIAFQIKDDILGIFGEEGRLGKPIGSDIKQNKNTLLIIHALRWATHDQTDVLNKLYGNLEAGDSEIKQIKTIFEATKARAYAEGRVKYYIDLATQASAEITSVDAETKTLLLGLADYLGDRDK